jgi:biotin operon repressor
MPRPNHRAQIRQRLASTEPFEVNNLAKEIGCTPPAIHQVIRELEETGVKFKRVPIPGRRGVPFLFQRLPSNPPQRTLEERVARIEAVLGHHNLGMLLLG